jgi:hypothetical protein
VDAKTHNVLQTVVTGVEARQVPKRGQAGRSRPRTVLRDLGEGAQLMPEELLVVLIVALSVETFGVAILLEKRVTDWFVHRGRNRPRPVATWVLLVHLAWLCVWFLVAVAARGLSEATGDRETAGWVVVPMIAVYGPFVVALLPTPYAGFTSSRVELRKRGATNAVTRALYWTSAPFAVGGLTLCFAAFAACFDS